MPNAIRLAAPLAALLLGSALLPSSLSAQAPATNGLAVVSPQSLGMDGQRLAHIDQVADEGIKRGKMPGCVVLVGRSKGIAWLKAYGHRQTKPEPVAMTTDTLFDLASLTKPIATATSIMALVEQGDLDLDAPAAKYLPEFGVNGKDKVTLRQLLTHQGGLIPDNSLKDYQQGPEKAYEKVFALKPYVAPGSRFVYSDVGFIVLGKIVEQQTGKRLADYSRETIFEPLGMRETGYLPEANLRERAAPTQQRDDRWIRGEVHDPRAYLLGGVAGHAGLFSTARDLARYARMMLGNSPHVLQPETIKQMTRPIPVSSGLRSLGWDKRSAYSSNRGDLFTPEAFGHGGFTGTAIWIDPGLDLYVIFLSNRVHPDGKGSVNSLAGRIGTIAAAALK